MHNCYESHHNATTSHPNSRMLLLLLLVAPIAAPAHAGAQYVLCSFTRIHLVALHLSPGAITKAGRAVQAVTNAATASAHANAASLNAPLMTGQPACKENLSVVLLSGLSDQNSRQSPRLGLTAMPLRPHSADAGSTMHAPQHMSVPRISKCIHSLGTYR